jgi:hypothetical protein
MEFNMRKLFLASSTIGFMALFSLTACVEDSSNAEIVEQTKTDTPESTAIRSNEKTDDRGESLMNKPVDFSSPENVEKTLENIRQQEGDKAHGKLKNAMQYIMVYDLSIGNNEEKLYKKLDGRTPEQIIAEMRR